MLSQVLFYFNYTLTCVNGDRLKPRSDCVQIYPTPGVQSQIFEKHCLLPKFISKTSHAWYTVFSDNWSEQWECHSLTFKSNADSMISGVSKTTDFPFDEDDVSPLIVSDFRKCYQHIGRSCDANLNFGKECLKKETRRKNIPKQLFKKMGDSLQLDSFQRKLYLFRWSGVNWYGVKPPFKI